MKLTFGSAACFLLLMVVTPCAAAKGKAAATQARKTQVVMLGTGTPNADPERSGPAVAIVVNGTPYLVDAGPGVVRRAAAAARKGVDGLEVSKLAIVFLTHLHSDHTLGLPDLIYSPWVLDRKEPLKVHGPAGTRAMTQNLERAYAEDIEMRLTGGEPSNKSGYKTEAHEIEKDGVVYKDANVTVTAFAVPHGSWKQAYGYKFVTPDRTIVISGDTGPTEAMAAQCQQCDVLVHEVYSAKRFGTRPPEWQKYHSSFHTSTKELGAIASKAKPKLLVLYHQLFWGATDTDLQAEVAEHYPGKVISARDLEVY